MIEIFSPPFIVDSIPGSISLKDFKLDTPTKLEFPLCPGIYMAVTVVPAPNVPNREITVAVLIAVSAVPASTSSIGVVGDDAENVGHL